jgi:ABC-type sugar transport system ATPase subunit
MSAQHPLPSSASEVPIVAATGVVKRFPGVVALRGVDFALHGGEVHCLVGENGAGKSSLIKVLAGLYAPDEGTVTIEGRHLPANTADAREAGIATVHQEHNLVPHLTVAENVILGSWPTRAGWLSRRELRRRAAHALDRVGLTVPLTRPARALSAAEGQLVEVARGVAQDAKVLILDEPTTALTERDVEQLFAVIGELRASGLAILYVSHKLDEILAIGDRITVFRDGLNVASGPASGYTQDRLVREMVGDDVELYARSDHIPGEVVLQVRGLSRGLLREIDLDLRAGEICGLGGLAGSGRTELVMCLFGADRIDAGQILIQGRPLRMRDPKDAIRAGIGLVPEERKQEAIFEILSVRENIGIGLLDTIAPHGLIRRRAERDVAESFIRDMDIRTPGRETPIGTLSGGNQQKVVIARWLARRPRVLILDEPTKGIDIGAKAEIHRLVERLARSGVAVLVISSDLGELLAMSDRVAVMREGRLAGVLERGGATRAAVMELATLDAAALQGATS